MNIKASQIIDLVDQDEEEYTKRCFIGRKPLEDGMCRCCLIQDSVDRRLKDPKRGRWFLLYNLCRSLGKEAGFYPCS